MDLRKIFSEDVVLYEKYRPRYCPALFQSIVSRANLNRESLALEIGCGTGQATQPFLETGSRVVAIELGQEMADFVREKYTGYPNFEVVCGEFEQYTGPETAFDLIYSATAFHWIPEEIGYPKVFNLLKPGGLVALFWNRPQPDLANLALHEQIQAVYTEYTERGMFKKSGTPMTGQTERREGIVRTLHRAGFVDVQVQDFLAYRAFSAEEYVKLLDTYSDHRSIPADVRVEFYEKVKDAILRHGDTIRLEDHMDLYMAKKP